MSAAVNSGQQAYPLRSAGVQQMTAGSRSLCRIRQEPTVCRIRWAMTCMPALLGWQLTASLLQV